MSPDIPILSDEDFPDDSAMPDLVSRTSIAEDPEVSALPMSPILRGGIRHQSSMKGQEHAHVPAKSLTMMSITERRQYGGM